MKDLIGKHIDSVYQLEVLLLLRRENETEWDAERLSRELRIDRASVETCLAELGAGGLVARVGSAAAAYRYQPSSAALDQAVALLDEAYMNRRVAVISLIYAKPQEKVKSFADAFRLRKDDKNG
ncbi:MAG: hypothetical protein ACREQ9_23270 [Candidatus Binatia bacterium]